MSINELVVYILVWPVLSAIILLILVVSLIHDIIRSRREGKEML
ncbi:MAG TPA: putative transporter small subunit [Paenalcaligenes sp.]|nr:putative transporter small subunit [Paenalcaligenes sp.]